METQTTNIYRNIIKEIRQADHILITSHKSPDGDSVGSSLGLWHFIQKLGKKVFICHPDPAPDFLVWLEGAGSILTMQCHKEQVETHFQQADLIFCLDYNEPARLGEEMQPLLEKAVAKKIMIDHHLNPLPFADITVSETSVCSTAQLIYELIEQSGNGKLIDGRIGTALYLGILTDTGSFRFPSVQPRTHEIIAKLLEAGVVHHLVHENLNDNNTVSRMRIQGYAMSEKLEVLNDMPVAIIHMTEEELKRFNAQKGDTEGIANMALTIKGIKAAIFLSEKDGKVKISFRSKGDDNPVNGLAAEHFGGGGHANASGGTSNLSMADTIKKLKEVLPAYFARKD
ncbi:MAG TPA: bifunctional oligoribonuclease/PAP phosphatase NrnA [Cytophagaceae bacterium]